MKTILVDDEFFSLRYLEKLCRQIPDLEIDGVYQEAGLALEHIITQRTELILMDVEMPGLTGIEAISRIRNINPEICVIFITGYEQYALQAFQLDAVSYIIKPCSIDELKNAVNRAAKLAPAQKKRIEVFTFGNFVLVIDGIPIHFSNKKAKELLALLVDRNGGVVTIEQATDILWEGRPYDETVKRLYRKSVAYLNGIFNDAKVEFFQSNRGSCHIIPSSADCDYFDLFNLKNNADIKYRGEYMLEYSWAEATIGKIEQYLQKQEKW